jgi:hypothetical protein
MAAAREAEILTMDLADDGASGVQHAGDDGRIDVGDITFERRCTVHHRNAGERDVVLESYLLAGQLTAGGSLDLSLDVPGVVLVLLALGAVARRARIFHCRDIVRHGVDRFVSGVIRLHQGIV